MARVLNASDGPFSLGALVLAALLLLGRSRRR
jgi:MYXO-CTERM domain-containing protein